MKYNCNVCNYTTSNKSNFNKHNKTVNHNTAIKNNNTHSSSENIYSCNKCKKQYLHKQSMNRHLKNCNEIDFKEQLNTIIIKLEAQQNNIDELKQLLK